ncbi:amidohydrolase family protein [Pseudonocardia sp. RS010]|uniref:amidohydrolase family protein n=1 Tax=Pseudonocardia sp. RS010 TaxID=3385979 RepID=UPI00399F7E52
MYEVGGERYVVVDAHVHAWDGSPHNQAGPAGEQFVADLYHRHRVLDRSPRPIPFDEFAAVGERSLAADLLGRGHVDRAVLQPLGLGSLFVLGFAPSAWSAELAEGLAGRFAVTGELDPADDGGRRGIAVRVRREDLRGLSLTSGTRPEARLELGDPALRRALGRAEQAGAGVVHLGVGAAAHPAAGAPGWCHGGVPDRPTGSGRIRARWPSWAEPVRSGSALPVRERDARPAPAGRIDPGGVRPLVSALPRLRFVLGAGCLPTPVLVRLAQLPGVHVLLTEVLTGLRTHPREAGEALDALLAAFGPERLLFGSGYPLVRPERLVEETAAALLARGLEPPAIQAVLGANAARLYRLPVPEALVAHDTAARAR